MRTQATSRGTFSSHFILQLVSCRPSLQVQNSSASGTDILDQVAACNKSLRMH